MDSSEIKKFVLLGLVLLIIVLASYLIFPFIIPILASVVAAFTLYPVFKFLSKRSKKPAWIVILIIFVFLLITLVPFAILLKKLASETFITYITVKQKLLSGELFPNACVKSIFCDMSQKINQYLFDPAFRNILQDYAEKLQKFVVDFGSSILFNLPRKFLDLLVFCCFLFYFLKDGEKIMGGLRKLIPLEDKHQEHLINKTKGVIYGVLYGQFLTAIIQGVLGGLVLYLLGINNSIFWGTVITVIGILPVGTWLIWLPMGLFVIYDGAATSNEAVLIKGIILLIFGILNIIFIDNLLRYYWTGAKSKEHTAIVLLGTVGGLLWFGFIGIFIGPLILTLLFTVFEFYIEMRHMEKKGKKKVS